MKIVLNIHWKSLCWIWNSNTLATWCKELTHFKRPWCWERVKVGGEGVDRGWDGWMASSTQWTWVWVNSGSWWWTGRPGGLWFMGLQRVGPDWATELNWYTPCNTLACFPWKESYDRPRQHVKKKRHHFADKVPCNSSCGFSSSHVRMWELDCKEGWAPKKLMLSNCDAGEDSWESLGLQRPNQSILKEINPEYSLQGLLLKLKLHILVTWCEELTH